MNQKTEIHFDNIEAVILDNLQRAKVSIKVASAWFTNKTLMACLKRKADAGLNVELIISNVSLNDFNPSDQFFQSLLLAGGEVFTHGAVHFSEGGIMHNKFCIVDEVTVINGSFNWTQQASRNEENITLIRDEGIAKEFNDQFIYLRTNAKPFGSNPEVEALQLSFTASNYLVDPGQEFQIHWEAQNATSVEIDHGIGIVPAVGSRSYSTPEDTHLKATVKNGDASLSRSIFIRIIQKPELTYTLTYLDPKTGAYLRLFPQGGLLDSYSVLEGQQLSLQWSSKHADLVLISGQGECPLSGSVPIAVNELTSIKIEAFGIKHVANVSFSIRPIKFPQLKTIISPLPDAIHVTSNINFEPKLVPSSLSISGTSLQIHCPTIEELQTKIISKQPTIKQIADTYQVDRRKLTQELQQKSPSKVLTHLKDHFRGNRDVLHFISSLLKRHV